MKKVGFFGGCFNPPTNVHIGMAKELIESGILDKVIFVPVGDYYKKENLVPAIHRYNMLKLACNSFKNIEVEDISITHKEKLFATDTFKMLYDKYNQNVDMYMIMGSDNFEKMPTWKNYEEIINKYKFVVIERLDHESDSNLKNVIYYKNTYREDISSTCIRDKLQNGEDVSKYLDLEVFRYIQNHRLYFSKYLDFCI